MESKEVFSQITMISPHTLNQEEWKAAKRTKMKIHTIHSSLKNTQKLKVGRMVFYFNSGDEYIKRAFLRRGFIQNNSITNLAYDIRWDIGENLAIFGNLNEGQLYNHFLNNEKVTTKTGLTECLSCVTLHDVNVDTFYPRAFNFNTEGQIEEFTEEFDKTALLNFIKKYTILFKSAHRLFLKYIEREYKSYSTIKSLQNELETKYSAVLGSTNYMVNTLLLKEALGNAKKMYANKMCTNINKKPKKITIKLNPQIKQAVINISTNYKDMQSIPINEMNEKYPFLKQYWKKPTIWEEFQCFKMHKKLAVAFPQYKIDGCENIWVNKPSYNSRGVGIYLFKDKKGLHNEGKTQQNKLIQKYIERPLLMQIYNNGVIENRKFDIRQWVLVTSFYPLQIYYFDTCYLKICGSEFKLDDIKDRYRHLSNYSLQKTNIKVTNVYEDLIMSIDEFENHIKKWQDPKYNWKEKTLPGMKQIIIETLKSGSESIVNKPECFEMYGFDIVLDYKYKPWLIEVNLSPACSERTKWLSDVLSNGITR